MAEEPLYPELEQPKEAEAETPAQKYLALAAAESDKDLG